MPAPLSIDLRQRVIAAYQAKEGSQRELAKRFKVSLSFVSDLTRRYRQARTVEPKPYHFTKYLLQIRHLEYMPILSMM